ncbi:MAG: cellulase family glycosylhydrolase [Chloroflexi bacterium]|nr:cellulase family glycosylhydrolase [Chloroflexota bacterium]MCC6892013.1 cellulase family glycosylhydrolase [Anaerolineae bacterium]
MKTLKPSTHFVFFLGLTLLFAACSPQAPTVIYVTPTHEAEIASAATEVPTLVPPTETLVEPTVTPTVTLTETPLPAGTVLPTNTPLGAIIGGDYTLPPTSTPRPTETLPPPTEGPTSEAATAAPPTSEPSVPTTAPTSAGPKPTIPNLDAARMGIQLDPNLDQNDWNKALDSISNLGVKWLKVQISWKQLQPNNADEVSEDFRRLEIYLESAYNKGLDILISVAKAPAWARSNQTEDGPPDDPNALAKFINLMTLEFGTSLDAIEVWNEPNLSREWQGKPLNGASYMQLFMPSYTAINAYSEQMKNDPKTPRANPIIIISAGLAPTSDNTEAGSRDDRAYLQEMYNAGLAGLNNVYVGIHPYGWGNPPDSTCCQPSQDRGWDDNGHFFFSDNVNAFRDIMVRNNHTNGKMFATEFGYATWDNFPGDPPQVWMSYNNRTQQGTYLVRAFEMAQSMDFMGPVILWNLNVANKVTISNRDEMAAYSITFPGDGCAVNLDSPNRTERPAYWMIYDAVRPGVQLDSYC